MIKVYHSKWGVVPVDTDNVTDEQLARLDGMTREKIAKDVANTPKDLQTQIDDLKARLEQAGII